MFAFSLIDGLPSGNRTVWSRFPLQPLAAGPLTPFSYSVIEEVAKRAWYQYFDELDFEPMPRARILQQRRGRLYLNLSLSAQRDAIHAATEPVTMLLNGERFPVTKLEKPSLFGAFKASRNRKKIDVTLAKYQKDLSNVVEKAAAWYTKTADLRWTQAEVLQIMEEIERVSTRSFQFFFAARHNLERAYNRLLWLTHHQHPYPTNLPLINNALCEATDLQEYRLAERLMALGQVAANDSTVVAWLEANEFSDWTATLPNQQLVDGVHDFLGSYGHRCINEAEIRTTRWLDAPEELFAALHAYVQKRPIPPTRLPSAQPLQRLLDGIATGEQKEARRLVDELQRLQSLQSHALHAFAYTLAGTHRWALAAANEAMADGRLQEPEDVFFFALEEVKQMMTGEWNISTVDKIRATCQQRRADFARWQEEDPPWLFIGDAATTPVIEGISAASGQALGPLRRWETPVAMSCSGAIVGAEQFNSGWAMMLPFASALLAAGGTPLDPLMGAARAWHIPALVGLGQQFHIFTEGAQTTVDGDQGYVEQ